MCVVTIIGGHGKVTAGVPAGDSGHADRQRGDHRRQEVRRRGTIRVALLRERDGVLNKDDDQALRACADVQNRRMELELEYREFARGW